MIRRVKTLAHLVQLSIEKRSVVSVPQNFMLTDRRPTPAAWVVNLPGERLFHLLSSGLFVYEPKGAKRAGKKAKEQGRAEDGGE